MMAFTEMMFIVNIIIMIFLGLSFLFVYKECEDKSIVSFIALLAYFLIVWGSGGMCLTLPHIIYQHTNGSISVLSIVICFVGVVVFLGYILIVYNKC